MSYSNSLPRTGGSCRRASTSTITALDLFDRDLGSSAPSDGDGAWPVAADSPTLDDISGWEFGFLEADGEPWRGRDAAETMEAADLPFEAPPESARPHRPTPASLRKAELVAAATVQLRRRDLDEPGAEAGAEGGRSPGPPDRSSPAEKGRPARGPVALPGPGDEFLGFRIVEELGRGTFGRVFLAQQGELARRPVALKVTSERPSESQTLAQLQHTNIVPIFSVHHDSALHAVCMPYFGRTTLADLLDDLMGREDLPSSGLAVAKVIESRQSRRPGGESGSAGVASQAGGAAESIARPPSVSPTPPAVSPPATSSEVLREIGHLSYVNAVLWIIARVAAGLAHAHKRGILHRDLKPANVLMTDDGQPMILDFNLSEDTKESGAAPATLGGTLRYMSPEHLDGFMGRPASIDARSDLFALGIMLYELLTAQSPFPVYPGASLPILKRMAEDRRGEIVPASRYNPAVTPAIGSIIRTCLQADPARRYASAEQVQEDIERHLAHLPLRHAPEVSTRERASKWLRRHPRLGSTTSAVVLAGCCLLVLASMVVVRGRHLARFEAARELGRFREDATAARFLLGRPDDPDQRRQGLEMARAALARYGVLDDPGWFRRPAVARLAGEAAAQLRGEVAEVLLMMSQAALAQADRKPDADQPALARVARRFNEIALLSLPEGARPQALAAQRAALARILDGEAEGARLAAEADKLPLVTARDFYLAAAAKAMRGEYKPAIPLAEEAIRLDPQHFWAYFVLGVCREKLGAMADATACFTTCTALRPDYAGSWLYRGLNQLARENYHQARSDFERAGRLRPTWAEPDLMKALASRELGDHVRAHNELTRALELGGPPARIHLLRSAERRALGDSAGADEDLAEGLKHEPTDVPTWTSRGLAHLRSDPRAALADFEAALKVDPNDLHALQYSAYLLYDMPGRTADALRMLDRAVAAHPDFGPARSGRGVLLALLGRRDEAHRDAREALWRDTRPMIQYQVAGIYATTSKSHPEDRAEAYRLLGSALRAGYGFDMIDGDRELDPIRDQPEFRQLVASARSQATERIQRGLGR